MSARIFLSKVQSHVARATLINKRSPMISRCMVTLQEKGISEETKYFRDLELKKKDEIRQNVERILALDDSHEEKKELVDILEKSKEPPSFISKLGLDDWKIALPVGIWLSVPLVHHQIIMFNEETILLGSFVFVVGTVYNQLGDTVASVLDKKTAEVEQELKKVDDGVISQIKESIKEDEQLLTVEEYHKDYYQVADQLSVVQADVLNHIEAHKYRDAIVKKLDALNALEESTSFAVRSRLMSSVKSNVIETFKSDRKVKEAALNQAIAVLSAGPSAKLGKDIVGEVFTSAIGSYKTEYSKIPAGSDPILAHLEKEMAAIAAAPAIESTGGNVFVTHPIA
eukprot:gene4412-6239_t